MSDCFQTCGCQSSFDILEAMTRDAEPAQQGVCQSLSPRASRLPPAPALGLGLRAHGPIDQGADARRAPGPWGDSTEFLEQDRIEVPVDGAEGSQRQQRGEGEASRQDTFAAGHHKAESSEQGEGQPGEVRPRGVDDGGDPQHDGESDPAGGHEPHVRARGREREGPGWVRTALGADLPDALPRVPAVLQLGPNHSTGGEGMQSSAQAPRNVVGAASGMSSRDECHGTSDGDACAEGARHRDVDVGADGEATSPDLRPPGTHGKPMTRTRTSAASSTQDEAVLQLVEVVKDLRSELEQLRKKDREAHSPAPSSFQMVNVPPGMEGAKDVK